MQGIILAGGESKRFGEDKAAFPFRGKKMIAYAVEALQGVNLPVTLVTRDKNSYADLGVPRIVDLIPAQGPLVGLWSACMAFPGDSLMVLTCDMPWVSVALLERLRKAHQPGNQVTLFDSGASFFQPFPGIYHVSVGEAIQPLIENDQRSLQGLLESLPGVATISAADRKNELRSVNTLSDLDR